MAQMTVSAVRPWRAALREERCLPASVLGPMLFWALRRLASICWSDVIGVDQRIGFVSAWSLCAPTTVAAASGAEADEPP